jgi:hypothetical protein
MTCVFILCDNRSQFYLKMWHTHFVNGALEKLNSPSHCASSWTFAALMGNAVYWPSSDLTMLNRSNFDKTSAISKLI